MTPALTIVWITALFIVGALICLFAGVLCIIASIAESLKKIAELLEKIRFTQHRHLDFLESEARRK